MSIDSSYFKFEHIFPYNKTMKLLKSWQKQCKNEFEKYVDSKSNKIFDIEFRTHIEELRSMGKDIDKTHYPPSMYPSPLDRFIRHFNFPYGMSHFLRVYILENKIDYSLARSSLALINELDNTHRLGVEKRDEEYYWDFYEGAKEFKLVIPSGASISEIREFITENKDFIDEKLKLMNPNRKRRNAPRYNARRDARVKELWAKGLKHREIAKNLSEEFNGTYDDSDIATMINRLKLKQKNNT